MKKMMMTLSLALLTTTAFANPDKLSIKTVEVEHFQSEVKGLEPGDEGSTDITSAATNFSDVGQVIAIGKEIVALGEQIYTLVQKGKPTVQTDFAPIQVVPKDPVTKEAIDPFDMENCAFPTTKKYSTSVKTGEQVVAYFEYMVVFTYNCSYNGKGKYIQNAMVQPVTVRMGYGFDFNATMKLSGIMNHGSKSSPNVGALLTIKYSILSWRRALEKNETIHITGDGQLKNQSM